MHARVVVGVWCLDIAGTHVPTQVYCTTHITSDNDHMSMLMLYFVSIIESNCNKY